MLRETVENMCRKAKDASFILSNIKEDKKNAALLYLKHLIDKNRKDIKKTNEIDIKYAEEKKLNPALIDRLMLNDKRIDGMIESLDTIVKLKDPIGEIIEGYKLENGLNIEKVRVPIGVIGIIYESRPNVTIDAAALCLKSSNCSVLRGGKESINTNKLLSGLIQEALRINEIPENCVNLIENTDRKGVDYLIKMDKYLDLIVPRGGESLTKFVSANATVSVVKHDKGLCHTYVDEYADISKAINIVYNAKVQRPGVCNAMETLLVHKNAAEKFLPDAAKKLTDAGVELRGCKKTKTILNNISDANDKDWDTEYLSLILSIKIVDSLEEAINHINAHGSSHSEAIVTENYSNAEEFLDRVDAACVYINASTRFTDGAVFGMGAEIGISTNKLHARGPVGLRELTTYKYKIRGSGQIRK